MRLINRTHWRSDHLRAIVARVAQQELNPAHRKRFTVEVTYNRTGPGESNGSCSGWAHFHSRQARVMVPSGTVDHVDLAHTIAHEMAHTRGLTHKAMRNAPRYQRVGDWREQYAWADGCPLERKPPVPRPSLDERREAKLATARTRLAAWEQNVKHAETFRRKWARTVRRLESTMQKAAQRPEGGAS